MFYSFGKQDGALILLMSLKWHLNWGIVITDAILTVTKGSDSFASFGFVLIAVL